MQADPQRSAEIDAGALERALAEVFSRPEFAGRPPAAWRVWLAERLAALREWLSGLFPGAELSESAMTTVFWAVVALLVITALGVLLHFGGTLVARWQRRELSRRPRGRPAAAPVIRRAVEWEALAREAAAEGRWRDAALALYQALLLRLESRGALRLAEAKTPGDYRREVRRDPQAAQTFERFLRTFEPVAFGGRGMDATGYRQLEDAVLQVGAHG